MIYNDEEILSPTGYQEFAKAYNKELQKKGFIFVSLNTNKEQAYVNECLEILTNLKTSLFSLNGFLGTTPLYNLTEKHLLKLNSLFNLNYTNHSNYICKDKSKCFLIIISLENLLINKLIYLAENSTLSKEILIIIKERTSLTSSLFKINNIISSYLQ